MKISIRTPLDFLASKWPGGSTTQLYISPVGASYTDRNFELRLSTAKVEVEESTFTSLPGVKRKLMILEGEIQITHEGQYSRNLRPYDVDTFSGDWKTTSIGTCTDFNVMTKGGIQSELYHIANVAKDKYYLKTKTACKTLFLYVTSGNPEMQIADKTYLLERENILIIEDLNTSSISLNSGKAFGVVVLEI